MKLAKSLLLGSAATLVATAGYAADLPSKKAAPVNYVKVCDAYGAGFFYIPGTETCVKLGGRVRSDYAFSGKQDLYSGGTIDRTSGAKVNTVTSLAEGQNLYGWEVRGRVDFDARTATAYGTAQAVASLRLARTSGTLDVNGPNASSTAAGATLEAAYIRFAGFTFGVAKDNFAFMPSTFYGAGHWGSFANGAKQIAYTAVLGGGFSATVAVQDMTDTTLGASAIQTSTSSYYNGMPQINGRVDFDQAWGTASVMAAVGQAKAVNTVATLAYDKSETTWAVGGGLKLNLPMIAAGDVLWLNAAYADGMTEYTTNWSSFKSSDTKRVVGGYVVNHPSWVVAAGGIETVKSWNAAAVFTHFWAPQWRHSFLASYGKVEGTTASKAVTFGSTGAFGDATVWNIGTQLAFLPTSNFEIGVDVLYARVEQDVRRAGTGTGTGFCVAATDASCVTKEKTGNWTGRLRVERTF